MFTTRTHGHEKATIDDTPSAAASILAPGMDRDAIVPWVDDPLAKTSAVRGAIVVDCVVPFILAAKVSADDFGVVDFVHGDDLVAEALVKHAELAGVQAQGLEVDSLDGHGVDILFVVGVAAAIVFGKIGLRTSVEQT
jgi:hypothetical protein